MNDRWMRVTTRDRVPPREGRTVMIDDREIALFNLGDRFFATDNTCPHRGGPLCDGIVTGSSVVCPLHAWKVNLETGAVERPAAANACVQAYPTRLDGDVVLIGLPLEATVVRRAGPVDPPTAGQAA
jgi:nitrite reductase (NADH) small subunit